MPKKQPQFVRSRGDVVVNRKIQIHGDRRTKRARDRSTQHREAVRRSLDDE